MTVSTVPGIAVPEISTDAVVALGGATSPVRDAADPAGALAAFPLLLQLLRQSADAAPSPAEPMSPGPWDMGLIRGLLPVAHGAALPEADGSGRAESGEDAETARPESPLVAGLPMPQAVVIAPPVLAALLAPTLGERAMPSPAAPRLAEPLGAAPPSSSPSAPSPGAAEGLRPSGVVEIEHARPSGAFALPETTPGDGADVAPGLPEWQGRPQSVSVGSDPASLRVEIRPAGLGPVAASRRDETRSDAGTGEESRDGDPRAPGASARVERGASAVVGLPHRPGGPDEVSEPPARGEPSAPRPLVEQVVTRLTPLRQGHQEVSLRLEPPDLGSVRVEAVLDGQRLTLRITAEQESAKTLLESTLPRLKESLSQQGFVTDQLTVGLDLDASAREFAGRGFARFERPMPTDLPARAAESVSAPARWRASATDGLDLWA